VVFACLEDGWKVEHLLVGKGDWIRGSGAMSGFEGRRSRVCHCCGG